MRFTRLVLAALALTTSATAMAQDAQQTAAPAAPPKLIVTVSVDQFSADLFAEYRAQFTQGLARLQQGAVFPAGYQSHAATETCPGHSTILTGDHPARTGIIANDWVDLKTARADKTVYCAEDESVPGSSSRNYTVSDTHLKVPTLGERMKALNPASRVVSVAGKDRAAVMMGGHKVDELWWWDGKAFVSYAGRAVPAAVAKTNQETQARIAEAQPGMTVPAFCQPRDRAVDLGGGRTVGNGHFARAAGDGARFRASPEFDAAITSLAINLATDMKLGQGPATDLLIVGESATDYVGHGYGTEGSEMCLQLLALDQTLGRLFAALDRTGVDYAVVLTADHGGHDIPERNREHGLTEDVRMDVALTPQMMGKAVQAALLLPENPLHGGVNGDVWIDTKLTKAQHDKVVAETVKRYAAHPQVAAVFTHAQLEATPPAKGPPETWTLAERARASFVPARSGDLVIALKPRVVPIPTAAGPTIATHGSFWDYDRRVPILFWRKGMTGFEQPNSVETVDIAPTLAGLIGLSVKPGDMDGRCLDLDAGPGTTCR